MQRDEPHRVAVQPRFKHESDAGVLLPELPQCAASLARDPKVLLIVHRQLQLRRATLGALCILEQ